MRNLLGKNQERTANYNDRVLLHLIRLMGPATRAELAIAAGLTKPTIANISERLSRSGLVRYTELHKGPVGRPPLRLEINPEGAFSIGLSVDGDDMALVVIDIAGNIRALVKRISIPSMSRDIGAFIAPHVYHLLEHAQVPVERVLGIGVAMRDPPKTGEAIPHATLTTHWSRSEVVHCLTDLLDCSVYQDLDVAAAALYEKQTLDGDEGNSFYYIFLSSSLDGCAVVNGGINEGGATKICDLGLLPDHTVDIPSLRLRDTVSLSAIHRRMAQAGKATIGTEMLMSDDPVTAEVISRWLADATASMRYPLLVIMHTLDFDNVVLGGTLPPPLLERLTQSLSRSVVTSQPPGGPQIRVARAGPDAPAIGAAMLPIVDQLLPPNVRRLY